MHIFNHRLEFVRSSSHGTLASFIHRSRHIHALTKWRNVGLLLAHWNRPVRKSNHGPFKRKKNSRPPFHNRPEVYSPIEEMPILLRSLRSRDLNVWSPIWINYTFWFPPSPPTFPTTTNRILIINYLVFVR